jgi:putative esterase
MVVSWLLSGLIVFSETLPKSPKEEVDFVPLTGSLLTDCSASATPRQRICRVRRSLTPAEVRERLSRGAAWVERGELTIAAQSSAGSMQVCCGVQGPLSRIRGTDLWVLTVRIDNIDRSVLGLEIYPDSADRPIAVAVYRGRNAGPPPLRSRELHGSFVRDSIPSDALGASRTVSVYLPPGWPLRGPRRAIYLADGRYVAEFAGIVDTLILQGKLPPVALVGLHAAPRAGESDGSHDSQIREREYAFLEPAHEKFFVWEAPRWAESRFGLDSARSSRAIWGVSNGGFFAIAMGLRHPDRFGHVIAFSPAGRGPGTERIAPGSPHPRFFILSGYLEAPFERIAEEWLDWLAESAIEHEAARYVAGHDMAIWEQAFGKAAAWFLGG